MDYRTVNREFPNRSKPPKREFYGEPTFCRPQGKYEGDDRTKLGYGTTGVLALFD